MANQSYLVAVVGSKNGVLAQCFAQNSKSAQAAVSAIFDDTFDEIVNFAKCIDIEAVVGFFKEGSAAYILRVIDAGAEHA